MEAPIYITVWESPFNHVIIVARYFFWGMIGHYSDPPEMENLTGAASHGRKLRNSKGRALEASTVQYCDKWGYILIQVGATSWDLCTKILIYIEGYNLPLRGISLRSTMDSFKSKPEETVKGAWWDISILFSMRCCSSMAPLVLAYV